MNIQENIDLKEHTTFRIGGPARFFVEVSGAAQLEEALAHANENKLKYFILAGGSNVLFSDDGFDGLVVKVVSEKVSFGKQTASVGAGAELFSFLQKCAKNNLSGLENLAGIPGSVGGAVRGNAGAFGTEISDCIESVTVFDTEENEAATLQKKECTFSYRESTFKESRRYIILDVAFAFEAGEQTKIEGQMNDIVAQRNQKHIQDIKSAGSFFMNPVVGEEVQEAFKKDTGKESRGGRVPAGWLLEQVGMDKKRIGDIQAGEMHANYFINVGNGTAEQVIQLASLAKSRVRTQFGVQLKEEVTIAGLD